jgi:hypothetical protein
MRRLNKKYWPHMVRTRMLDSTTNEAFNWCKKNLPGKERWTIAGPDIWYFKKERDVTMFTLRWSA